MPIFLEAPCSQLTASTYPLEPVVSSPPPKPTSIPDSGSFILQLVFAAPLGGLFIIKGYWHKIKGLFTKKGDDPEINEDRPGEP
jgi:hypothetical protein